MSCRWVSTNLTRLVDIEKEGIGLNKKCSTMVTGVSGCKSSIKSVIESYKYKRVYVVDLCHCVWNILTCLMNIGKENICLNKNVQPRWQEHLVV